MDLTGIETRKESDGTTRYRAYTKVGNTKVRSSWTSYAAARKWRELAGLGAAEAPRKRRRGERVPLAAHGFIYFIQAGTHGPVKIGWSGADPKVRLATLQSANYEPLTLIGVQRGTGRTSATCTAY